MPAKTQHDKPLTTRRTDNGKRLTPSEKILILAEKGTGKSYGAVGKKYGVAKSTVQLLWKDDKLAKFKEEVSTVKEVMAGKLYLTADKGLKQVNARLEETTAPQAAVIVNTMIQNARLLDNESTQNVSLQGYLGLCNKSPSEKVEDPFSKQ